MQYNQDENDFSEFKKSEKFYKKLKDFNQAPDLITFEDSEENLLKKGISIEKIQYQGKEYTVYNFEFPKGFKVIKNYLQKEEIIKLTKDALNNFPKEPHRTNMYIYSKEYIENVNQPKNYDKDLFIINDPKKYFFNTKTRWSNLGQHYNWDHRCYFPDSQSPIPENMSQMAVNTARIFKEENYNPQSVIVNYYVKNKAMGGHLDDGEPDQIHPIVSFSLGLSCVFLIGGKSKTIKPVAVRLDSGDVVLMSEQSRVCYHGVPRIIKNSFKWNDNEIQNLDKTINGQENNEMNCYNYLQEHRINFNFRQVVFSEEQKQNS